MSLLTPSRDTDSNLLLVFKHTFVFITLMLQTSCSGTLSFSSETIRCNVVLAKVPDHLLLIYLFLSVATTNSYIVSILNAILLRLSAPLEDTALAPSPVPTASSARRRLDEGE